MAKKLLTAYTFTPGAANTGTIVVSGTYALEQFLLITNVTTGATVYQFNKPAKGGAVSTGGGNTTLTLEADTSAMNGSDRLQVFVDDGQNAQVTLTNASVEISNDVGNPVPVSGTVTATGPLTDTQLRASAVPVSAASLPLPSGAATSANQSTANTSLASIDTKIPALVGGRQPVDGSGVTQPISAASLPLPTGAATETTLSSVNTKLPSLVSGSLPVLVQNGQLEIQNDTGNPIPVGPAAQTTVTGSASANNTDLISVACDSFRSVAFQLTGTWSGTISFQTSLNNADWVSLACLSCANTGGSFVTSTTSNLLLIAALPGYQFFRIRFTAYTSGTASVIAEFSKETYSQSVPANSPTNTVVASTATSGTSLSTVNSAANTNAASIKASAANLYGISVMNASAATKYVRFFNKASAPTMGTDVPIMVVAVPATSSKEFQYVPALRFGTGLAVAITGGAAATDSTAVAAGDVQLLVSYA